MKRYTLDDLLPILENLRKTDPLILQRFNHYWRDECPSAYSHMIHYLSSCGCAETVDRFVSISKSCLDEIIATKVPGETKHEAPCWLEKALDESWPEIKKLVLKRLKQEQHTIRRD
jgi:hypothetical protein